MRIRSEYANLVQVQASATASGWNTIVAYSDDPNFAVSIVIQGFPVEFRYNEAAKPESFGTDFPDAIQVIDLG